jgi:hypothetical protein
MRKLELLAVSLSSAFSLIGLGAEPYPMVAPLREMLNFPEVSEANASVDLKSPAGVPLYRLQCHSAGYTGDPAFDYSGEFECRLSSLYETDRYSTLLTEDVHQSRDWESRGRFFSADLRGSCATVPEFGATRNFSLRGFVLTLRISDPEFSNNGKVTSLRLTVIVRPEPKAVTPIAQAIPVPKHGVPKECRLEQYFADFSKP